MLRHTFIASTVLLCFTGLAYAMPTDVGLAIDLSTDDGVSEIDGLRSHAGFSVSPGGSGTLDPFDPSYGAIIDFQYTVATAPTGDERTVTFRFETRGSRFVEQAATDLLTPPTSGGRYSMTFFISGLSDDDRVPGEPVSVTNIFSDSGGEIHSSTRTTSIFNGTTGFGDVVAPSDPSFFFNTGGATIFERSLTYAIVPEPASLAMLGIAGLAMFGRRRQACRHR